MSILQKISIMVLAYPLMAEQYEERFEAIYREKLWGTNEEKEGFSGGGSILEKARPFYDYLTYFLRAYDIKTVVDLGCGDWTFARNIDWSGIDYTGYDVVETVIEKNKQKYASDAIHFVQANFLETEIPAADLLICKHVLQHIPNKDVFRFIQLLPKFKHCLILDAAPVNQVNLDFPLQETFPFWEDRGIDLRLPPFNLKGEKILEFTQDFNLSGKDRLIHIDNRQ